MSGELVPKPADVPVPMQLIEKALERGLDPSQLEKLFNLQERYEKARAAEAFAAALQRFQAECPTITKNRTVKDRNGAPMYRFASFDDIMATVGPVLNRCGITIDFDSEQTEGMLRVTVRLRVGSHHEDKRFSCPIPADMRVNDSQKYGAALSYAKRYALCAALAIVVTDQDTDASTLYEYVRPEELEQLEELIKDSGADRKRFLDFVSEAANVKVPTLDKTPRSVFPKAVETLKRKQAEAKKARKE